MSRIAAAVSAVLVLLLAVLLTAQTSSSAPSPETLRKQTAAALAQTKEKFDSIGAPLLVKNLAHKSADFYLIPVLRDNKLVAVYRDDPRRNSVTEIASSKVLRYAQLDLFTRDGAARRFQSYLVENPDPVAVSCGPLSAFGALNSGWYQRTGDSYVLLSFGGKLITHEEVAEFWPEYTQTLREFRR